MDYNTFKINIDKYGYSISDFAALIGETRQNIYTWKDKPDIPERIANIVDIFKSKLPNLNSLRNLTNGKELTICKILLIKIESIIYKKKLNCQSYENTIPITVAIENMIHYKYTYENFYKELIKLSVANLVTAARDQELNIIEKELEKYLYENKLIYNIYFDKTVPTNKEKEKKITFKLNEEEYNILLSESKKLKTTPNNLIKKLIKDL
jgi:hypothetical protein